MNLLSPQKERLNLLSMIFMFVCFIVFFCNVGFQCRNLHVLNVSNPVIWVDFKAFNFIFLSYLLSPPKCTAIQQGRKPCILCASIFGTDLAVPESKWIILQTSRLNCLGLEHTKLLGIKGHSPFTGLALILIWS